jgi:hypothetical protein
MSPRVKGLQEQSNNPQQEQESGVSSFTSYRQAIRNTTHFFAPAERDARREFLSHDGALALLDAQADGVVHLAFAGRTTFDFCPNMAIS